MNKCITVNADVKFEKVSYQQGVRVKPLDDELCELCLAFCLMKEKLIDKIQLVGKSTLFINLDENLKYAVFLASKEKAQASLDLNSFEFLMGFCLEYYVNGFSEVNHVDIQAEIPSEENNSAYITFEVENVIHSLSPEELSQLLDSGL